MDAARTQHVLDAIDGALDDWTVSEDAMRWTPEPALSHQPRQIGRAVMATGGPVYWLDEATLWLNECRLLPWQRDVADVVLRPDRHRDVDRYSYTLAGGRGFGRTARMAALVEAHVREFRQAAARISAASAASAGEVEQLLTVVDQLDDENPRARALRLRRQRGTGPGRTAAGQQKRPRSLA